MEQVKAEQMIYSTAIYCRLSKDDEQAGKSVSIQTQLSLYIAAPPLHLPKSQRTPLLTTKSADQADFLMA